MATIAEEHSTQTRSRFRVHPLIQSCIAEGIGTFGLVFAGTGAVIIDAVTNGGVTHVGIAVTFGLIIFTMISAVGHISGAHFNPAVTIAFASAGHFPWRRVLPISSPVKSSGRSWRACSSASCSGMSPIWARRCRTARPDNRSSSRSC